jgi:hypothetical protein
VGKGGRRAGRRELGLDVIGGQVGRVDVGETSATGGKSTTPRPRLEVSTCRTSPAGTSAAQGNDEVRMLRVEVEGTISLDDTDATSPTTAPVLEIFVDAILMPSTELQLKHPVDEKKPETVWHFAYSVLTPASIEREEQHRTLATVPRDMTMVVVLAKSGEGQGGGRVGGCGCGREGEMDWDKRKGRWGGGWLDILRRNSWYSMEKIGFEK